MTVDINRKFFSLGRRVTIPMPVITLNNLKGLYQAIDHMNLEIPDITLVSGKDLSVFDLAVSHARKCMEKSGEPFEVTVFSGESGDDMRFHEEVFNIPLFAPLRLIIVRRAGDIFRPALNSPKVMERYGSDFVRLPDRTWIIIEYDGSPSRKFIDMLGERVIHYPTRELYDNQVHETLITSIKKAGLKLTDDALHEIQERVEPGAGVVERTVARLKDMLPPEREGHATLDDIREILFPSPGMNPFKFVDTLFELNHPAFRKEVRKFNPAVDSLFPVLKLVLNRTNEIRKTLVGLAHGMDERELVKLLDLQSRPPGLQTRIVKTRKMEARHFTSERISAIYGLLIELQHEFRSITPPHKQMPVFQERILPIFFSREN